MSLKKLKFIISIYNKTFWNKLSKLSIQKKVNVVIFITFVILTITYASIQFPFQHRRFENSIKRIERLLQTLVERDNEIIASELYQNETDSIKKLFKQLLKIENIKTVCLYNNTGKLKFCEGTHNNDSHIDELKFLKYFKSENDFVKNKKLFKIENLIYTKEIFYYKEKIGYLQIHYSIKDLIYEQYFTYAIFAILIFLNLVMLLLLIKIFLSKIIIKPITYLNDAMQQIRTGELGGKVNVKSLDEIGDLADTFNQMSTDLSLSYLQISNQNRELENRVEARTKDLKRINAELKLEKERSDAATVAKSEFLANMSHEIRTPMNGVIAAADLVLNENISEKVRRYMEIIQNSGYSLLGIINDILDYTKIDVGKIDFEKNPFYLNELLENVIQLFLKKAEEKNIELLLDIEPNTILALNGDTLRIQQILVNLIGNAIKFTPKNGEIILGVLNKNINEENVLIKFFVKDNGVGIKKDYLSHLFNPFTQADASTTRKYGGTGLGLTICKKLVELMGGKIWVESEENKGTTFNFTLHLKRQHEKYEQKLNVPKKLESLNILVMDEYENSLNIIKKIITSFGFNFISAFTLKELEKIIEKNKSTIDIIIIDNKYESLNAILKIIKANINKNIPIIKVCKIWEKIDDELQNENISKVLNKPVSASILFNTIMELFGESNSKIKRKIIKEKVLINTKELKNKKVLLVEDNLTNQEIAEAIFSNVGINIDIANNGEEAIEKINNKNYNVVFMDIQMPIMDGFEATKFIRNNLNNKELPIIAMTANAMKGDDKKCLDAGMNDYISKPINQNELYSKLNKILNIQDIKPEKNDFDLSTIQDVNGLDTKKALKLLGISWNKYTDILLGFLRNNKDTAKKIKEAYKKENFEELSHIFHTLKGSGANIGAYNLEKLTKEIEQKSKNKEKIDEKIIEESINELLKILDSISEIEEKSDNKIEKEKKTLDVEKLSIIIKDLLEAIDDSNPKNITNNLNKLKEGYYDNQVKQLEIQIKNYDYTEATNIIESIAQKNNIEI